MVNVCAEPVHPTAPPVKSGVTVNVATTGDVVPFVAVNVGMLPVPDAPIPMDGVLLVHVYDVPVPAKFTAGARVLLHTTASNGSVVPGVGFTVIENDCVGP